MPDRMTKVLLILVVLLLTGLLMRSALVAPVQAQDKQTSNPSGSVATDADGRFVYVTQNGTLYLYERGQARDHYFLRYLASRPIDSERRE